MSRKSRERSQTEIVREVIGLLGLPFSREGLRAAIKATRTPEAVKTLIEEGEWKGFADTDRVEREILPRVLSENPGLAPAIQALHERDECYWNLCSLLEWFSEKIEQVAGNRPLPSHIGVNVKNFEGEKARFGFLFWEEGRYVVRVKEDCGYDPDHPWGRLGDESQSYRTPFDAVMDGWIVD